MNRRQLMILPGAAAVAVAANGPDRTSHKAVLKFSRAKFSYKVPKSEKKKAKYLNYLTTVLELNDGQQQQAASIFGIAVATHASLRKQEKTARKALRESVRSGDVGGIEQSSAAIGGLVARRTANDANANTAFLRSLTPAQRARLVEYQS